MRKIVLGLTAALAVGALTLPTAVSAAHIHGGSGGHPGFSGGRGAGIAHNFSGARSFSGSRNFAMHNNARNFNGSRNFVRNRNFVNNNHVRNWNGNRWAWNGRHHRHNGWWFPYAAFGAYAAYDYCWQTQWTPNGYQRVYVCGPDAYSYF